jgi:hypothetical protein
MATTYEYLNNPAQTYTLEQFISMKNTDDMTYNNFSIYGLIDGQQILESNLIDEYLDELYKICSPVQLSVDEQKNYKYAPDLLAYDVYGSVQLDFIVLASNDMVDPKDFNLKKLKLPTASRLREFLNEVYGANSNWISKNRYDLENNNME